MNQHISQNINPQIKVQNSVVVHEIETVANLKLLNNKEFLE